MHLATSVLAFASVYLCQFLVWRRVGGLDGEERRVWGRYGAFSLVTGILSVVLFLGLGAALMSGSPYLGLVQRVAIAMPWIWLGVSGFKLTRI